MAVTSDIATSKASDELGVSSDRGSRPQFRIRVARRFDLWTTLEVLILWSIIVVPLTFVAMMAFTVNGSISASNVTDLLLNHRFRTSLRITVFGAATGTFLTLVLGTMLAIVSERVDVRPVRILKVVAFIPLFISPLGGAVSWAILGNERTGILWNVFESMGLNVRLDIYTVSGIIFVLTLFYTPYVFVVVSNALSRIDAGLEEAAAVFGGGGWQRISKVLLPLLRIPAASAGLVVFALMIGSFAPPTILGSPGGISWLPTFAYNSIREYPVNPDQAGAVAFIMVLLVLVAFAIRARILFANRNVTTIGGKGFTTAPRVRAGVGGWLAIGIAALYVLLSAALPTAVLVGASLRDNLFVPDLNSLVDSSHYSLERIRTTSRVWIPVLWNTVRVGVAVAIFGAFLSFVGTYVANGVRATRTSRLATEVPIAVSIGVPGIVFGLGYLWAGVRTPIYGTLLLMIIAFTAHNMAQGYQAMAGPFLQMGKDLEESAAVFGAGRTRRIFLIVLPSMFSSVVFGALFMFIFSVRELSSVLFIYTPNTRVLSVQAFQYWFDGQFGSVAVVTLVQSLLMLLALIVARLVVYRKGGRMTL